MGVGEGVKGTEKVIIMGQGSHQAEKKACNMSHRPVLQVWGW